MFPRSASVAENLFEAPFNKDKSCITEETKGNKATKIMTAEFLMEKMQAESKLVVYAHVGKTKLVANMSSIYTKLIKEAGRCNRFSSDIIYDINYIEEQMELYPEIRNFEPILIGFRKDGIDNSNFVLSRCNENPYEVYNDYFALYSLTLEDDPSPVYPDFKTFVLTGYAV